MRTLFAFMRSVRGRLLGLNANQARFDILQSKLDALAASMEKFEASVDQITNLLGEKKSFPFVDKRGLGENSESDIRQPNIIPHSAAHSGPVVDRVGFLVHSLELINHFGCVWDLLPEGGFDVVLHGDAVATEVAAFARWKCKVVTSTEVIQSNTKYRYLISNHPISLGDLPLIKQLAIVNVRFMYSAGKSGWNLSEWNNLYEVIMCFGPHHAAFFADSTDALVLQMGYPRFDRYFTMKPDLAGLQARYGCDPKKQTVVWLPTWKTLSSVGHFDEEISSLIERYNVVVKLHPLMPESEPERVEALRRHNFTHVIADASDNLPLYQLADYMLFDYGGPPLAGIYADKELILLNVPGADIDELTGDDSPDISIRKHLVNVDSEEGRIANLLADSVLWKEQRAVRRMLRNQYFAPYFGFSSIIAANALLNLEHIARDKRDS